MMRLLSRLADIKISEDSTSSDKWVADSAQRRLLSFSSADTMYSWGSPPPPPPTPPPLFRLRLRQMYLSVGWCRFQSQCNIRSGISSGIGTAKAAVTGLHNRSRNSTADSLWLYVHICNMSLLQKQL